MRILVACESSGVVRESFRALGHDAWSCDLQDADDNSEFHIVGDAVETAYGSNWDMMIAHPPCTYLAVSGMHWTTRGLRDPQLTEDALNFVQTLMDAPIEKICIENPVSVISTRIRTPDQCIQPWMFGHDASKKTCLWLKNLQPLKIDTAQVAPPRGWVVGKAVGDGWHSQKKDGVIFSRPVDGEVRMLWGNQTPTGQNKLGPSTDRWKNRSKTYTGIAMNMASQWGTEHPLTSFV
jgi:hypothetical protein